MNIFGKFDLAIEDNVRILNEGDNLVVAVDVEESNSDVEKKKGVVRQLDEFEN